jgi:hypothetical protein
MEELPDYTEILSFTIPGRPSTKKTSQRIVRMGKTMRILPSITYEKYEKHCKEHCENAWKNQNKEPVDCGVGVYYKVYLDSWIIGDSTGYFQAIGDILEKYGIIANDMWIYWLNDGSHTITVDKANPRCEIKIVRFRHPYENYRAEKLAKEAKKQKKQA